MRKQPSLRWSRTKVERTLRTVEMLVELARMDQERGMTKHAARHLELAGTQIIGLCGTCRMQP